MQYLWQHRLWPTANMATVDGRRLQVLDQGKLNTDSGPDFFNAKIKLDDELWVGDVEIHVRASDWFRHNHDTDAAYDSVILHVVDKDDAEVRTPSSGSVIPQYRMECNPAFADCYRTLVSGADTALPCTRHITELSSIYIHDWISSLAYSRLIEKAERILSILNATTNNWEEACYVTLARALGTGTNGDAFQRLALSAPLRILGKHSDNLMAIESVLFGQAGLLNADNNNDPYYQRLRAEYRFMCTKFGLKAPDNLNWKMGRMRPANFPHRRIALLALFVHGGFRIMSSLLECDTPEEARSILSRELTGYWSNHYNFQGPSASTHTSLSTATSDSLVINVAVPMLYAFGTNHSMADEGEKLQLKAIRFLENIMPEKNFITVMFSKAGINCRDAFTSQALIQLRRNYCETKKCIYCRFGHGMLASKAVR